MKHFSFVLLLSSVALSLHQALSPSPLSFGISPRVTLTVSPRQEANFNAFKAWLSQEPSLKENAALRSAYESVFTVLKNNDAAEYLTAIARLEQSVAKLREEDRQRMYHFFLTLSKPEGMEKALREGECRIDCLFGSCHIVCPSQTKPKCFCQWGAPHCGCEPYDRD